jgi:branched-chain amino acid transport system substrate-binding protein
MGGGVDQPERRRAIADGSKRPLELTAVDAQAKPDIGLNAIKRLVGDPTVVVFLGPDWSSVTYPTLFVGEEAGSAQITSSVAQRITQEGQKHIFRARSTDGDWMAAMADYMVGLGHKQIGVAFANNEFGRSGRKAYAVGDKDFTPIAGRLVQSGVTAVGTLGNEPEGALLINSLRELGFQGLFAFNSADEIFAYLAKQNAVGVVGPLSWVETKPDDKSKAFVAAYRKRFNEPPIGHSVIYFDAINMLADAIAKAGPDRAAVLKTLKSTDSWSGVQGIYHPSAPNGDMIHSCVVIRYNADMVPEVVAVKD